MKFYVVEWLNPKNAEWIPVITQYPLHAQWDTADEQVTRLEFATQREHRVAIYERVETND